MMEMINLLAAKITTLPGKSVSESLQTSNPKIVPADKPVTISHLKYHPGVGKKDADAVKETL